MRRMTEVKYKTMEARLKNILRDIIRKHAASIDPETIKQARKLLEQEGKP